ncbi:hypothetical protein V8C40DRAFT_284176 [Trichoderma camerunense]
MNYDDANDKIILEEEKDDDGKAIPLEKYSYVKIHVCQASYGDCLAIEFDNESSVPGSIGLELVKIEPIEEEIKEEKSGKPEEHQMPQTYKFRPDLNVSKQRKEDTRKVFLIDGGPANYQVVGTVLNPTTPLANMYAMLNTLLPKGCPNALDTLVITHDDADHINGLHQMMLSMADRSGKGNAEFRFERGITALKKKKSPFSNVWYNSPTLMFQDPEVKGWFDLDIDLLKKNWPKAAKAIPECNKDFEKLVVGDKKKKKEMFQGEAKRANLIFEFLSPNMKQVNRLKKLYIKGKKKEEGEDQDDDAIEDKGKKTSLLEKKKAKKSKKSQEKVAKGLQGIEYKGLPNAAGNQPIYSNDTIAKKLEMTPKIQEHIGKGVHGNLNDTSAKNQSSLAFVVRDKDATFSAAFTGDGNAMASFLPVWEGKPLRYDVLKIMHHGSKHNNCWKKRAVNTRINALIKDSKQPLHKEALVDRNWIKEIPENCRTNGQDDPTRFFVNVLANKYIISSSTTEGHLNPHLSTLAGIITRAIVRKEKNKVVDIYLTTQVLQVQVLGFLETYGRPMSNSIIDDKTVMTEEIINAVMLAPPNKDEEPQLFWDATGSYYRIWQLRAEIDHKFGTIMLDPAEKDPSCNPAWQQVALTDAFWVMYHQTHFTTHVRITVGRERPKFDKRDKDVNHVHGKAVKTEGGNMIVKEPEMKVKKTVDKKTNKTDKNASPMNASKSNRRTTSKNNKKKEQNDDSEDEIFSMEPEMEMNDPLDRLMPPALGAATTDISVTPEQIQDRTETQLSKVWRQATGNHGGLSPATFARFDIRISQLIYETFSVSQGSKTKAISGTDALVNYLALRGWLLPDQVTALKTGYMRNNQITLGGIISLVFDKFLSTSFFSLLPITLAKKALFSTTPFFWPLSNNFDSIILSHPKQRNLANDFSEVKSMTFSVKPPVAYQRWDMPYRLPGGTMAFWQIKVLSELKFFIYRPFERDCRYVYGCFLGKLWNGQGSNVVVDFVWFPDKDSALDYHIRFADSDFVADGCVMKVGDLWSAIPTAFSSVSTLAASLLLPGKDTPIAIGEYMSINNCGFVVQKASPVVPDVTLNRIFGTVSFDQNQQFKPFGDIITIRLPTIGLQIQNLFSTVPLKVFVRIEERLDIHGFPVPIVFETRRSRGGDQTVYQLSYISSSPKDSLTPARLLDWLGVASSNFSDIPDLEKLLDSLHILSFSLGWFGGSDGGSGGKSFSAKPDFVELSIQLDQMNLVPDFLAVENAVLELRLDRSASSYKVSSTSYANLIIKDCSVQFLIAYGDRPEWQSVYAYDDIPGYFRLALNTGDSGALSISNILGHFMPNVACLPPALQTILTRTGITKLRLGIEKDDDGKNKIAMIDLEVILEEEDMEIFEGLSISNPRFKLRVDHPNDKDLRAINASISVYTQIEDEELQATIWIDSDQDTIIGMSIIPVNEFIALGEVIAFFTNKLSDKFTLNLPQDFSFMKGIEAGPMNVSFRKTSGSGYKIDSLFVEVEAHRDFELWDSPQVVLSDVKLLTNYIRGSGVHIAFGVSLSIGNYHFSGSLSYDRASSDSSLIDEPQEGEEKSPVVLGKDKMTSYTAQLSFKGELGLHDILSKLTGADFAEMLQRTHLEKLSKYTDIKIHSVDLDLSIAPSFWTFSITADLEWLAFTNVSLTASHTTSWAFDLHFQCKDGPLKVLPDSWAAEVEKYVTFGDTSIYLFYGPINVSPRVKQLTLNGMSRDALGKNGGIAISTSLNFGSNLRILKEWLKIDGLQVFGAAGAGFFILGVHVGRLTLLDNAFSISGGFLLSYVDKQPWFGLEGDFEFNIPVISKTPIAGSVSAGVDLYNGGLSFKLQTEDKLKDLGGIKGFDLDAIGIKLVLALDAGLMPTLLGVEGGVRIEDLNNVSGHLSVVFVAKNPLNSYLEGRLENFNLMNLLAKFAAAVDLPVEVQSFLQKNGINLQFLSIQLIPRDMVGLNNQQLKKRIYFEGSLSLVVNGDPFWAGYMLLDIKDSGFAAIALMDPIQLVDEEVFSLQRSSQGPNAATYSLQLTQVNPSYLTPRMLSHGPVLKITSQGPDPVFISAQLKFLGTEHDLFVAVNGDYFTAKFHSSTSIATLDFSINCFFKSSIDVAAFANLDLGEHILTLATTLTKLDGALGTNVFNQTSGKSTSVGFSGDLKIEIAWAAGKDPLSISLSGKAHAFDQDWDIGEIGVKITESDLRSLETFARQLWKYIEKTFTELVMSWIRDIGTEVPKVIKFLEENFDATGDQLVRLVSDIKHIPVTEIIGPVVKQLDMVYGDALDLYNNLGIGNFMGAKLLSPIYGKNPPPHRTPGWLPDIPKEDMFKFPTPADPGDLTQPIIGGDLISGFPGVTDPPKKPTPTPAPAPTPSLPVDDPFKHLPEGFGFPTTFSLEPDFTCLMGTEPEDSETAPHVAAGATLLTPREPLVARLPAWYTNEIEQYVTSPMTAVPADSVDETVAQIASFNEDEVIGIAEGLRLAGLSDDDIQKEYKKSFGHDMPLKFIKQILIKN